MVFTGDEGTQKDELLGASESIGFVQNPIASGDFRVSKPSIEKLSVSNDGETGIRTLGTVNGTTDFESVRFNRSRISPIMPWRTRTSDLQVRNLTLYPTELRAHDFLQGTSKKPYFVFA